MLLMVLLTVVCALLALPALVVLAEVLAARAAPTPVAVSAPRQARVAVLIPAHNESGGIVATLQSIAAQLGANDRMVVVADNCSDDTAAIARQAGAQVIERSDPVNRGKGYALDFGVRHLEADPPQVVIIVDADCTLGASCLTLLSNQCLSMQRPIQARYLMRFAQGAGGVGARVTELAFLVKNWVRPLGLARLGLPCPLLGAGMAFPWALIRQLPLASGNIVEDMRLGSDLVAAGNGPRYLVQATVDSHFPTAIEGQQSQRKRWEHGHLQTLFTQVPALARRSLERRDPAILAYALDLAVPPLALLVMLVTLTLLLSGSLWLAGFSIVPMLIALAALLALLAAVLLAWDRFARDLLSLSELAAVPGYALRKIPVYVKFVLARQTAWVRSKRDHE